jgi:hypothetical protein
MHIAVLCLTTHWTTGVRSPAEAEDFPCNLCVQIGSEAHPASYPVGTGGPFQRVKGGRGVTLTTHPHLMPRSRMTRSYTSLPIIACMAFSGTALLYFLLLFKMIVYNRVENTLKVSYNCVIIV